MSRHKAVAATALRVVTGFWSYAFVSQLAQAQTDATGADLASSALEEIMVTAQHIKENAQNTPIAMSVYASEALRRDAITDIAALSVVAPDVNFANIQGTPVVTIRGISSRDTTENGDPAVTVAVDGFYQNRPYSLNAMLYDLERIEVLRGPQGTLNGRNSVGGAINIVTAQPTDTFAARAGVEFGNYDALTTEGMVNLPVNDQLQVRASFLSTSHDGYRDNAPQPDGDEADNSSARVAVAFQPFTNFRGLLTFQYTTQGGAGDVSQLIPFVYTSSGALVHELPDGIDSERFALGTAPFLDLKEKSARFNISYDAGSIELTALGGYSELEWRHGADSSNPYSEPYVYGFEQNEYPDTLNAELRIASKTNGPFRWQTGAFYFQEQSHLVSANAAPQTNGTFDYFFGFVYQTESESKAAYSQASYELTDALKLTAGARYTRDYKEASGFFGNLTQNIVYANQEGDTSSTKTTYHLALDYQATDDNLLYAKIDTGYKAGGFNFGGAPYTPEAITAYEVGSKNRFLGDTLQLNVAAFYDEHEDQQVANFAFLPDGTPVALTQNAGASEIYGLETDLIAQVPVLGTVNAAVNYLHSRYTDFLSVADPSDPSASGNVQLAGNTPPQAPEWSAQLGIEHSWPVGSATVTGRIQSKLQSSSNFSFYNFPDTRQDGYTISDAFLSYSPETNAPGAGAWKVTAFVKNLGDSTVFSSARQNQYAYSYAYAFHPPRTYGLRLEVSW